MIIKKLELQGFKSFPERTKIVFHRGITAIVGPNGTGKSNIVDAILWVLGGQRQKGLRGEKTEDIIFNGNAKKPPLGMADVVLLLEHQEDETTISHRAFRSGESEYRLNGKAARLKDIQDTLWKRAVAEKEYFVIEQGSVGTLLTSKPAEKRALVEEAAGTAFYKDKKKDAQSKLVSSEQNLVRVEDIISEVGRMKNSLQRQAQAAVRYRKLREKIRELTGLNYRHKLIQLERRHGEALREHGDRLALEKEASSSIKSQERDLIHNRTELWELEKRIKETQEALFALESQTNRTDAERSREARRVELLGEKGKRALGAAEELERDLRLLESEIAERRAAEAENDRALKDKREEVERAAASSRSVFESAGVLEKSLETLKSRQLEALGRLTELRNESLKIEKELELLGRQEAKLGAELERERNLLQAKEESLGVVMNLLAAAEKTKTERQELANGLRASVEERRAAVERLVGWVEEIKRRRDEDRFRLGALRKLEESQAAPAAPADIPEILGRLTDLIDTDPESAALVDALWKEEAVGAVIPALDFLKLAVEKRLEGWFLLVSPREKEPSSPASIDDPDALGYMKSRLRPSPKIRDFLDQLREAVIVKDVPSAVRLWLRFPSMNFVTPAGDVLLSTGLLKVGRGEEGAFSRAHEVKELEERLERGEAELAPLSEELGKKLADMKGLEENLGRTTALLLEAGIRIHEHEKEKIAEQAEREKAAAAVSVLEKELEILHRDREALNLAKDALTAKIAVLEEEDKALRNRMEAEEKDFGLHRGRSAAEEKRVIELQADTALLEQRADHVSGQVAELGERREQIRKKAVSFREENAAAEEETLEAQRSIVALDAQLRSLEGDKKLRQAELDRMESDRQRKRSEEEDLEKKLAASRDELEKRKEERVRWEIAKAEVDRDMVNLEETCWQELKKNLHEVKNEQPGVELSDAEIEDELARAEEDLQKIKSVNLMAEEEYVSQKERYDFLVQQRDDLRQSIDATQEAIGKIDEESQTQFLTALAEVNKNFQEVFNLLFKGGSAEVKLLDPGSPQESGVEISAQPPGKKVQNVLLLSGGEKSLTSLAFLFALFRYKPTPFCILDEVDAALDDINLARFLDLMKTIKQDTQFIIITHNYRTMEVADFIYGTTMAEPNITTLYSVKLEKQPELVS